MFRTFPLCQFIYILYTNELKVSTELSKTTTFTAIKKNKNIDTSFRNRGVEVLNFVLNDLKFSNELEKEIFDCFDEKKYFECIIRFTFLLKVFFCFVVLKNI